MNILHLLSQNHLTGAEVYAVTLAKKQIEQGHVVHQVSNGFYFPTPAQQFTLAVETKSTWLFWSNVFILRKYLIDNKIQIIHAHSRAASKMAFYARIGLKIGYISTVHGRQHRSFSKKLMNHYGDFQIAVCENIQTHLINDFEYNPSRVRVVRNAVDEKIFLSSSVIKNKSLDQLKIAVIGRTTGPKALRTELFIQGLTKILNSGNTDFSISVIGGALSLADSKVTILENTQLNAQVYQRFDLICGSGRVCMEALMAGVPTIAFGERLYCGLITEKNFSGVVRSNFGDIGESFDLPRFDERQALKDIENLPYVDCEKLKQLACDHFGLEAVAKQVQRIYESSFFLRHYSKWIPVLMYHKIPDQDLQSQHKIFVRKELFEKHLQFFKTRGFKTLTFSDLALYRTGHKAWAEFPRKPLVLTFDDGYKDNLENADPLLKKYGFQAQLFLLAEKSIDSNVWDHTASSNTLPAEAHEIVSGEARQAWRTSNFEVGSHGFSHQRLTQMTQEKALTELTESKKSLEIEFEKKINVFAYTYGDTNKQCAVLAEKAGYDYAVNTDTGGLLLEESPYEIFRANIFPNESFFSLWKKTSRWYRKYYYNKRKK